MTGYPSGDLDARVELLLGDTWTDVTAAAMPDGAQYADIAGGLEDGAQAASPGTLTLAWDNPDGDFSPRNAAGPYFGLLRQNIAARVSVAAPDGTYLRLEDDAVSSVSCPDSAGVSITGSIDIRVLADISDWRGGPLLASKWGSSTDKSWALALNDTGTLHWTYWTGSQLLTKDSSVPVQFRYQAYRVVLTADDGAGGHISTLYTGPTLDGPWTQLGDAATVAGTVSIADSTAPVTIGYGTGYLVTDAHPYLGLTGAVYGFRMYDGTGTLKAEADFTAQTADASSFTDGQGNTWTLSGSAAITDRDYRLYGELSQLQPTVDTSGGQAQVTAQISGLLRRLQQGKAPPVDSPMKRASITQASPYTPVAYWPWEDAAGSSQLAPAIGALPVLFDGSPQLAADSSFACSGALPLLNGARLRAHIQPYSGATALVARFLLRLGTLPASGGQVLMRLATTGTCRELTLRAYNGGGLGLSGWAADGSNVFDTGGVAFALGSTPVWVSVEATPVSGGQQYAIVTLQPGGSSGTAQSLTPAVPASGTPLTNTFFSVNAAVTITGGSVSSVVVNGVSVGSGPGTYTVGAGQAIKLTYSSAPSWTWGVSGGTHGNATGVTVNPASFWTDTAFGHLSVQSAWVSLFSLAGPLRAWLGELAADRFARLCGELGITPRIYGPRGASAAMGIQGIDTAWNLLNECAGADQGLIYEPRETAGLGYRVLASMLNQDPAVTFSYSLRNLPGSLSPSDDDLDCANDVTAQRPDGSSARVVLDDGSAKSVSSPRDGGAGPYPTTYPVNVQSDGALLDAAGWQLRLGTVDEARVRQFPADFGIPAAASIAGGMARVRPGHVIAAASPPATLQTDDVRQIAAGAEEILGPGRSIIWSCMPASAYDVAVYDDPDSGRPDTAGSSLHTAIPAGSPGDVITITVDSDSVPWSPLAKDLPYDLSVGGERMTVTDANLAPVNFLSGQSATFDGGLGNWSAGSICTAAASTAQQHSGTGSMLMTATAAGTMTAVSCLAGSIGTQGLACSPGDTVNGALWFRADAILRACLLQAQFYTSGGVSISTLSGATVTDATTGWGSAKATISVTAPATAAKARLIAAVQSVAGSGEKHYADDAYFANATTGGASQSLTVIRGVNGVAPAHAAGEAIALWTTPRYSPV